MKPYVEKLPRSENCSFVARTYRTPQFEVPWHQHIEHELILFTEGAGRAFVGNYVGDFTTGDIFFLGSNLPHTFQKTDPNLVTAAVVVQFTADFWGSEFLQIPEAENIRSLLDISAQGLRITGRTGQLLQPMIRELELRTGFAKIIGLCECLQLIASSQSYSRLSTHEWKSFQTRHKDRIEKIFQYTIGNFQDPISLADVASIAGMSIPAFCGYFKKCTKKTFVDFLNEIRIGHACKLLLDTRKPILEICYESGYNTLANFNKQFQKMKKMTPTTYRKQFRLPEESGVPMAGALREWS